MELEYGKFHVELYSHSGIQGGFPTLAMTRMHFSGNGGKHCLQLFTRVHCCCTVISQTQAVRKVVDILITHINLW